MPRGNGRGPGGLGSMTGRAAGFCAGFNKPGFANQAEGKGFFGHGHRHGMGQGRGLRNRRFATDLPFWARNENNGESSKEEELDILKNHSKFMQEEMNAVNERIKELEKETSEKK